MNLTPYDMRHPYEVLSPEEYALLPPPIPGELPLLGAQQGTTDSEDHQSEPNLPQSSTKHGTGDGNPIMEDGIYIRVRWSLIQPTSPVATTSTVAAHPPTTNAPPSHLYLIEGTIQRIARYAGTTVDWVIKVAHLICSPLRQGQVYTHTTGTTRDWYHRDMGIDWRLVVPGEELLPGIYEFHADFSILLSRLSQRQSHSLTSAGAQSSASTFRRHLQTREAGRCGVTRLRQHLIASHLIPKRMGTQGAKSVVADFVGVQEAHYAHMFHEMIGILLTSTLDKEVDQYMLGFYHITVSNEYKYISLITQRLDNPAT